MEEKCAKPRLAIEALKGVRPRNIDSREPLERRPRGCTKALVLAGGRPRYL